MQIWCSTTVTSLMCMGHLALEAVMLASATAAQQGFELLHSCLFMSVVVLCANKDFCSTQCTCYCMQVHQMHGMQMSCRSNYRTSWLTILLPSKYWKQSVPMHSLSHLQYLTWHPQVTPCHVPTVHLQPADTCSLCSWCCMFPHIPSAHGVCRPSCARSVFQPDVQV